MLETLLAMVLLGSLLGIVTGLVPGLHVNTVAVIALGLLQGAGLEVIALIVSMAIVHTFVDFIPSIALGVPSEDNLLSVLPGQRFFLKGNGYYAVMLTVWGGLVGGAIAIAASPIFHRFLEKSATWVPKVTPFALAAVLALMVFDEKGASKRIYSLAVIALASLLGLAMLSPSSAVKNPLPVLVLGFFGVAPLLQSLKNRVSVERQSLKETRVKEKLVAEYSLLSALGASFVSTMPGVGPNQAALTVRTAVGKIGSSAYLVLLGGINTANTLFSLTALYAVGKTRTGVAAAIKQLIELQGEQMLALAGVCLIALAFGAVSTAFISKHLLRVVCSFNYTKLNSLVLSMLVALVLFFSNPLGWGAFAVSIAIGFGAISLGVKRSHCMAFLMAPAITYYFRM